MLATTAEMCERLKVCDETIYRMMADGRIPKQYTTKIGNNWRFNADAIEEHILHAGAAKPSPAQAMEAGNSA